MPEQVHVFETETGSFGYRVGGVYQEYHPDKEGFVPMTQEEAQLCGEKVLARISQE